jgi:hypothetical protein
MRRLLKHAILSIIHRLGYELIPQLAILKYRPAQAIDATQALNRSAGVANPRVLRGRSLSCPATLLSCVCEYTDKSVPFGKYCLSRPTRLGRRIVRFDRR